MKLLRTLAAGLTVSLAAPLAFAYTVVLNFDDLPVSGSTGGFFGVDAPFAYKGFNFDSASDPLGTGVQWFWQPSEPNYPTATGTGNNITPTWSKVLPTDPDVYDAAVISSSVPFQFKSAFFSGLAGPIGIELVDTGGTSYFLGANFNNFLDIGTGDASTSFGGTFALTEGVIAPGNTGYSYSFTNTEEPTLWLQKVVIWGQGYSYAVDDINVNVVPEPSAYAMALVGLAGLTVLARRRRQ